MYRVKTTDKDHINSILEKFECPEYRRDIKDMLNFEKYITNDLESLYCKLYNIVDHYEYDTSKIIIYDENKEYSFKEIYEMIPKATYIIETIEDNSKINSTIKLYKDGKYLGNVTGDSLYTVMTNEQIDRDWKNIRSKNPNHEYVLPIVIEQAIGKKTQFFQTYFKKKLGLK